MKLRSLGLVAILFASPAYADEATTVAQDLATKWQTAYNNGDAAKVAALYMQDAVWVRPTEVDKGKAEIEKAVASLMKQFPKLTVNVAGAGEHGNVVWYYSQLRSSTSKPSPVVLTMRPRCSVIFDRSGRRGSTLAG